MMPIEHEPPFFSEIREEGYHIYSLENAEIPDYYPDGLPGWPGISIKNLREGDIITIRAFFGVGSGDEMQVDSGYIDLRVEFVDIDKVMAAIITDLPVEYALSQGDSIEVFEEEILCKNEIQ